MNTGNMVTASAKKKNASNGKAKSGKVREISIRPADNGYTVTVDHEPAEGKDMYSYVKPETYVAESVEKALEHVKQCLGVKSEAAASTKKDDKGKVKAEPKAAPEADEYDDEEDDEE